MAKQARGHRGRIYAVYEDVISRIEYGVPLEQAFAAILKHCRYEPVWDDDGETMILRFRYLDGPYKGQLVGEQLPIPIADKFDAVIRFGEVLARDHIMQLVCAAGLRGCYATDVEKFDLERAAGRSHG